MSGIAKVIIALRKTDLLEEKYNFTCEAGPLSKCEDFIDLKNNLLYALDLLQRGIK